jgi:SAM-dependent methyltransferase
MSANALDTKKLEEFGGQMLALLNNSMLGLMLSIGHRTGLFDKMAELEPSTSDEIADAAGLQERYVREWLGGMVTGGIIDYDGAKKTYALPAEHAAMLTRAAGPDNLALFTQYLACLGKVEDEVVACFSEGGGVPYSSFGDFQKIMADESSQVHDAMLVEAIVPLAAGLPGQLEAGIDVLDVGCGSGHAVNLLAKAYPNSRFTGYDLSEAGIEAGKSESSALKVENTRFEVKDVGTLDESGAYGLITVFDAIHDQADPVGVLARIHECLRPGGTFLCVDIAASSDLADNVDHPIGPMLFTFSTMHCMTVSLARDGAGLGAMWGEERALQMLSEAGFSDVVVHTIEGDIQNNYYIAHKS